MPGADRALHAALERVGPRFTLGDLLLAEGPTLDPDADALRRRVILAVHLAGGHLDVDEETREVIYVVPGRVRAAILARDVAERARRARRATWRHARRVARAAFGTFLVASAALAALAVVALVVVAMSRGHQGRGGGGGGSAPMLPTYVGHGRGVNADFWYYLWMRDLIELAYWNNAIRYERARVEREYGVVEGVPVKPSSSSGMGGGREGAGESGEGGDSDRGGPNAPRAGPSAVRRAAGGDDGDDDDDDDDEEDDWLDRDRELTFFESIFAFVFGRGDVNDDLEVRRWRAVGALLRVNKGCVFAEQVAPFLDSYLLSKEDQREVQNGLFAAVFDVIAHARRMFRKKADEARDASRMHEGYMLEVLTRFGGYAEASDDGQLIYVFPSLQVTTMANVASTSSAAASRALGRAVPAPTPPPIYERVKPLWEGGEKMPLVVALGFLNIFLIFVFRTAGGMDFKPPRQPLEPRAQQTMGRRAGRFRDSAPSTSTTDEYGEPPLVILVLELFPWLCKLLMPLLLVYSAIFFLVPSSRALYNAVENRRIVRRNDIRKRRAQDTLQISIQETEKQRRARGKQALDVVV